jgi:hypothetical protein
MPDPFANPSGKSGEADDSRMRGVPIALAAKMTICAFARHSRPSWLTKSAPLARPALSCVIERTRAPVIRRPPLAFTTGQCVRSTLVFAPIGQPLPQTPSCLHLAR